MTYPDLRNILQESSSSRAYFLSLPVETQLFLHKYNEHIHTMNDLHRFANWYETPSHYPFRS